MERFNYQFLKKGNKQCTCILKHNPNSPNFILKMLDISLFDSGTRF